jgi:hypothetical protein
MIWNCNQAARACVTVLQRVTLGPSYVNNVFSDKQQSTMQGAFYICLYLAILCHSGIMQRPSWASVWTSTLPLSILPSGTQRAKNASTHLALSIIGMQMVNAAPFVLSLIPMHIFLVALPDSYACFPYCFPSILRHFFFMLVLYSPAYFLKIVWFIVSTARIMCKWMCYVFALFRTACRRRLFWMKCLLFLTTAN